MHCGEAFDVHRDIKNTEHQQEECGLLKAQQREIWELLGVLNKCFLPTVEFK